MSLSKDEIKRRESIVIDQCGGIQPPFESFYIMAIRYAALHSSLMFDLFDQAVSDDADHVDTFTTVQEALSHAAALSRFFWPSQNKNKLAQARGAKLRRAFNLNELSSLKSRNLRNAFEHYDEKLDEYLLTAPIGYFFPRPIVGDHEIADEKTGNIFKLVDPDAGICVMLGKKFEFRQIQSEVQRILEKSENMEAGGRHL